MRVLKLNTFGCTVPTAVCFHCLLYTLAEPCSSRTGMRIKELGCVELQMVVEVGYGELGCVELQMVVELGCVEHRSDFTPCYVSSCLLNLETTDH